MYLGGTLIPTSTGDGVIGVFENNIVKFECYSTWCDWKATSDDLEAIPSYAVLMPLPGKYSCEHDAPGE